MNKTEAMKLVIKRAEGLGYKILEETDDFITLKFTLINFMKNHTKVDNDFFKIEFNKTNMKLLHKNKKGDLDEYHVQGTQGGFFSYSNFDFMMDYMLKHSCKYNISNSKQINIYKK